jgi:hypothetical protein
MKKIKYITVLLIGFSIFVYGFIRIGNDLPQILKDKSSVAVYYNKNPFELKFHVGNYIIFINDKALENYKNNTIGRIINASKNSPVRHFINDIRTN